MGVAAANGLICRCPATAPPSSASIEFLTFGLPSPCGSSDALAAGPRQRRGEEPHLPRASEAKGAEAKEEGRTAGEPIDTSALRCSSRVQAGEEHTRAPAPAAVPIHQRLAKGAKKGEETAEQKKERKAAEAAKKAHDKAEKRKAQLWAAQEARSVTKLQSAFRGRLGRKEAVEKAKLADALYPEEREKVNVVLSRVCAPLSQNKNKMTLRVCMCVCVCLSPDTGKGGGGGGKGACGRGGGRKARGGGGREEAGRSHRGRVSGTEGGA